MKKILGFFLFLSLLILLRSGSQAQTRPRRVGDDAPVTQSSTQGSTSPAKPPVLGGSNYPGNRQPATQDAPAKSGPEEVDAGDIVKVDTTLVTIPVSVMDRDGRYVPNLRKEDFRVWEDGVEQQVAYFASTEKPFTVALVIDTSGSTRNKLEEIQDAAIAFVDQLRTDDRVMIVSFNDKIRVLTPQP